MSNTFQAQPPVNKDIILNTLDQVDIMEYYLGVEVNMEGRFRSPLRVDQYPTCSFSWYDGKLWFRDWAHHRPWDIFDIVQKLYKCDFYESIQIIAEDFGLRDRETRRKMEDEVPTSREQQERQESEKSEIHVSLQSFTQTDIDYLTSYGIHSDTVQKFNVFSPETVWLNRKMFYTYQESNPALAYYFGKDEDGNQKWKIYFYKKSGEFRFLCNTSRINGWVQIPDTGNLLVLTKSLKDVMCMYEFGLDAIAMQAESTIPYDYIIDELKGRFDNIVTIYDDDEAGRTYAHKIWERFDIPYYFIAEESLGIKPEGAKDFSDYIQMHGDEQGRKLVEAIQKQANANNRRRSEKEPSDLQKKSPQELEAI